MVKVHLMGGAVKRMADQRVKMGADIQTPKELCETLQTSASSIKYFWVSEEDILKHEAVPEKLPVVKGTMKIHQIVSLTPGKFSHREQSCFCSRGKGNICDCFSPNEVDMNVCEFPTSAPATIPHHTMTTDIVGRFVIVKYDAQPFVGQVLNLVGDELEVSCM